MTFPEIVLDFEKEIRPVLPLQQFLAHCPRTTKLSTWIRTNALEVFIEQLFKVSRVIVEKLSAHKVDCSTLVILL